MSELVCEFCSNVFSNKYSLEKHKKTAQFCLDIQKQEEIKEIFNCEFCNKIYNRKDTLLRHVKLCKIKEISEAKIEKLKNEVLSLTQKLNELIVYQKLYEEEKIKCDKLEEKYEKLNKEFREYMEINVETLNNNSNIIKENVKTIEKISLKAIESAGTKTINNNKIYQQLIPLTNDYIKEQSKNLEIKHIMHGAESLAVFAKDYSLKNRVICTDVARRNFVFKDEDGSIIKDPKGVKVTKKFLENNKEELVRLLKEYARLFYEEDCPYEYKDKVEIDECLYAVQSGDIPSNMDSYNKFEKQFTLCFSKLVYNMNCDDTVDCRSDTEEVKQNVSDDNSVIIEV